MDTPKRSVLVIDDSAIALKLYKTILRPEKYNVYTCASGKDGIFTASNKKPDVIILDVVMPEMNGFEVAKVLKNNKDTRSIPIIMVTSLDDKESRITGLKSGAEEFINKPVDRTELLVRVNNLMRIKSFNTLLENYNVALEKEVAEKTEKLKFSYVEAIIALSRAAEDIYENNDNHARRICRYSTELAKTLNLDKEFIDQLFYASPLYDIGKIRIPSTLLLKIKPLNNGEIGVIQSHTVKGFHILKSISSPYLMLGAMIALNHHERWDGTGYPNGLKCENIPLGARIVNICDQYDSLRSKRPYRPAFDHKEVLTILAKGDDRTEPTHFDPEILEAFKKISDDFDDIYNTYTNLPIVD